MTTEFTADDLKNAVLSNDIDAEQFFNEETGKYEFEEPVYKSTKHPEYDYLWSADRDERGFPVVAGTKKVEFETEDELYDYLADIEFTYEGGFVPGFGNFKMIDNGHLGDGHDAWALVEHESGRLFRIGGWYSSWDSGEWNEVVEVEPAEVHVVRYKPLGAPDSKVYENPAVTVK